MLYTKNFLHTGHVPNQRNLEKQVKGNVSQERRRMCFEIGGEGIHKKFFGNSQKDDYAFKGVRGFEDCNRP